MRKTLVLLIAVLALGVAGASVAAALAGNGHGGNPHTATATTPQPPSKADQNQGGANGQCPGGPYCSTRNGSPSQNGNGNGKATGKPCAGCVGKADNKNPKGQMPNGSDHNKGYECDKNHGVGKSNPAHTGCTQSPPPTTTTTPQCTHDCGGGCKSDCGHHGCDHGKDCKPPCTHDCKPPCTKDCGHKPPTCTKDCGHTATVTTTVPVTTTAPSPPTSPVTGTTPAKPKPPVSRPGKPHHPATHSSPPTTVVKVPPSKTSVPSNTE